MKLKKITIESGVSVIERYAFSDGFSSAIPTIYCEDAKKPEGWNTKWNCIVNNYSDRYLTVVWDYKNA